MSSNSIRFFATSLVTATLLVVAGCGGGGSSSSAGSGGTSSTGATMVKGNVTSVNVASTFDSGQIESYVHVLGDSLISPAYSEERTIEGIKVCILERCDFTDANGNFEIDLSGFEGGEYVLRFILEEREYSTLIEVVKDAVVTLGGVSISDDGVVRVSNIRVDVIEQEPIPDGNVVICHVGEGQEPETIEVPISQKNAHLEHGDELGPCGGPPVENFPLCHVEGDDQVQLHLTIGAKEEHLEFHPNDYPGECEAPQLFPLCHVEGDDQVQLHLTIGAKEEHLQFHDGDRAGECVPIHEETFLICHVTEGGQETLEVNHDEFVEHLEHHEGDDDGPCP